jgi:integrase
LGSHAIRHAFGAILKKKSVREELRADLLGHRGKTETTERYCEATEIAAMHKLVCKMPSVTAHLLAHQINLPGWITNKETPPFSHPSRAKRLC